MHAQVEEVRRRQDMELQRVIREVEQETARVVSEGEQRLEALYREQEDEVAGLVLDWQGREVEMRRQGREGGREGVRQLRQESGNRENRLVELVARQGGDIGSPAQQRNRTEVAGGGGGQEAEAGGGGGEGEGGVGRGSRWFEATLAPLIVVALLFIRIIFI